MRRECHAIWSHNRFPTEYTFYFFHLTCRLNGQRAIVRPLVGRPLVMGNKRSGRVLAVWAGLRENKRE